MIRLVFAVALVLGSPVSALAQSPTNAAVSAARADGKAFARQKAAAAQAAATTEPDAARVPNYPPTSSQSGYYDDPERISADAAAQATAHPGYQAIRNSMASRARFAPVDLDAVVARSEAISADPLAYTSGMSVGGTQGRCVPLPSANTSAGRYQATCNTGYKLEAGTASCTIPLVASVTTVSDYLYYCQDAPTPRIPACTPFEAAGCPLTGSHEGRCLHSTQGPGGLYCDEPGEDRRA